MRETAVSRGRPSWRYEIPFGARVFRATMRPIFRLLFRVLCKVELLGLEYIPEPRSGSYVIAHNHISLFEPPLISAFWPIAPEAIADADVFDRPIQKLFVRSYHAIPFHRGEYDRAVIEKMSQVLDSGRPLAIAPEGGRSHVPGLRMARSGVAYIMDRARVPVVPVALTGTTDDMLSLALRGKRPQVEMRVGEPFLFPDIEGRGEERRTARQRNADHVMQQIASLLPEQYRGVYAPL